jgi:hypothetical protein
LECSTFFNTENIQLTEELASGTKMVPTIPLQVPHSQFSLMKNPNFFCKILDLKMANLKKISG